MLIQVRFIATAFHLAAMLAAAAPVVTDVLVDGANCRGAHVSTRPHNRKVVYHAGSGNWFVFYGTGHWIDKLGDAGVEKEMIAWRSSGDGRQFGEPTPAVAGNGHSSSTDVLLVADRVYLADARFGYWRTKAGVPAFVDGKPIYHRDRRNPAGPNFASPYEVFEFEIDGGGLALENAAAALPGDAHVGHAGPHYGSLTRDTNGHLWVAARATASAEGAFSTWVARSRRPDDITTWERHSTLFASEAPGTHAPQIIALDRGRVGKPYRPADWMPPLDVEGNLVAPGAGANQGDDDLSLSADLSNNPAPLALVHRGGDLRLHLRHYDGRSWSPRDVKIGLQDEALTCDEASAVADFSHGLGVLYWCQWKDPSVREMNNAIGQLRFSLVKDPAALFQTAVVTEQ